MTLNKRHYFDFDSISGGRAVVLGIATLMVVLFHSWYLNFSFLVFRPAVSILNFIKDYGEIGVELFLLLSGLGLYYSFSKDGSVRSFYKKRVVRVFPVAFLVAVVYYGFTAANDGIISFLYKIFFIDLFINGDRAFWYFSLLLILYLSYPLIHKFIEKKTTVKIIILLAVSLALNVILLVFVKDYYLRREVAFSRIPVFIVGVWFGYLSKKGSKIPLIPTLIVSAALLIVGCYFVRIQYEYKLVNRLIYCVIGVAMVIIFSWFVGKFKRFPLNKYFSALGLYSIEVYLLYERVSNVIENRVAISMTNPFYYLVVFAITLVASVLLHFAVSTLTENVKKYRINKRT